MSGQIINPFAKPKVIEIGLQDIIDEMLNLRREVAVLKMRQQAVESVLVTDEETKKLVDDAFAKKTEEYDQKIKEVRLRSQLQDITTAGRS